MTKKQEIQRRRGVYAKACERTAYALSLLKDEDVPATVAIESLQRAHHALAVQLSYEDGRLAGIALATAVKEQ